MKFWIGLVCSVSASLAGDAFPAINKCFRRWRFSMRASMAFQ